MKKRKQIVILLSGGKDSVSLLWKLINGKEISPNLEGPYRIHPVFVNYGQKTYFEEQLACERICTWIETETCLSNSDNAINSLVVVSCAVGRCTLKNDDVQYAGKHPAYVPYRNLVLLSLALSATEEIQPDMIVMGVHNIDVANHFPDCSGDFAETMQNVVDVYTGDRLCEVVFPFCTDGYKSKEDITKGVPKELLDLCFSGYGETLAAKLTTSDNTVTQIGEKKHE